MCSTKKLTSFLAHYCLRDSSSVLFTNKLSFYSHSMADNTSTGEKRPLEDNEELNNEKKKNNDDEPGSSGPSSTVETTSTTNSEPSSTVVTSTSGSTVVTNTTSSGPPTSTVITSTDSGGPPTSTGVTSTTSSDPSASTVVTSTDSGPPTSTVVTSTDSGPPTSIVVTSTDSGPLTSIVVTSTDSGPLTSTVVTSTDSGPSSTVVTSIDSGPSSSTPPLSPNASSTTDTKPSPSSRGSKFGSLFGFKRFFSTGPTKDKEFWEKLSLEEKRKHYKCGKEYLTLEDIKTWPEFFHDTKAIPSKDPPKYSFNKTLNDKVSIFQGDITKLEIDAIVNAANSSLMGGGGVDGAIHSAASYSLRDECAQLNGCNTGHTKITTGHRLPAKHILHTVGPFNGSSKLLESCYNTCYELIKEHSLRSVAFCCIATGVYGFPNEDAAHIALDVTRKWLEDEDNYTNIDRIIFVVFLKLDLKIYTQLMQTYFPLSDASTDTPLPVEATPTASDDTETDPSTLPDSTPSDTAPDTPPNTDTHTDNGTVPVVPNLVKSVTAPATTNLPPPSTDASDKSDLSNVNDNTCEPMEEGIKEEVNNEEDDKDVAMETEEQPVDPN